jgi:hypothetical protein
MTPYKETYPRAYKCSLLVDTPDKVKKFLVGRQFFVIFVVSYCGRFVANIPIVVHVL